MIDATIDIDNPNPPNKYPAKNNQVKNKNTKFHVYGNLKLYILDVNELF